MSRFMAECPHCDEMFDDEDDWFEHVSCCADQGERCSECGEPGCQGHCAGDDMMGSE